MRHTLNPLAIAIATALVACAPAIHAAPAPDPAPEVAVEAEAEAQSESGGGGAAKDKALGEITVTARRREETLLEVPVSVTALTEPVLERLNVTDLSNLQGTTPNLTIYAARGSSSTLTAYIRGIGQSDPLWGVDPGVGLYIDDVYIARPQGALLDVLDVERIEVLRGPQGTLYGKNTIGGAIKYVTKPLLPTASAGVRATIGNYSQADLRVNANMPLGSDAVVARFAAASLNRDGFGENIRNGAPMSDKEILVARGALGFYPSEDVSIVLTADWMDDQSGARGAQMLTRTDTALGPAFPPPVSFNRFDPTRAPPLPSRYDTRNGMPNVNDTTMQGASATVNWRIDDSWGFKYILGWRKGDTETNIDFDTLPNIIADVAATYRDEQTSHEINLNYDGGGAWTGVLGLYLFDGEAGGTVRNNFFNASFGTTNGQVDTDSWAVYGDWTWQFSERWSTSIGLRYTDEEKKATVLNRAFSNATFTVPIATLANFVDTVDFQNWSPRLSLEYQPDEDTLYYGLVTRGFKSGGFNVRANTAAVPLSARPFDDETVTSWEFGTKRALAATDWYLNAAVFHNDYKDVQLSVFTQFIQPNGQPAFFGDFTNAGAATINGIEFELAGRIGERTTLSGMVAYLDAEYDEFIDRGINIADLQKLTNAPDWQSSLTLAHTWDAFGGQLEGRVTGIYQGGVWPTTDLSIDIYQSGYTLFNAGLVWRADGNPWTFALQGSNLTDREYRTTGYNIPALGILTGFYGPPRQFQLIAAYEW